MDMFIFTIISFSGAKHELGAGTPLFTESDHDYNAFAPQDNFGVSCFKRYSKHGHVHQDHEL